MKRIIFFSFFLILFDLNLNAQFNYRISKSNSDTSILKSKILSNDFLKTSFLDIYEKDFNEELNYIDAQKACINLGINWRLPTLNELELIFEKDRDFNFLSNNKFVNYYYWTSTDYNKNNMWVLKPIEPTQYNKSKSSKEFFGISNKFNARAVKNSTFDVLFENPNIEFTYKEIIKIFEQIGDGWRLPSSYELVMLKQNNNLPINYGNYASVIDPEHIYPSKKYKLVVIRESK